MCNQKLSVEDLIAFQNAISEDYIAQFYIDEIPTYDTVGWLKENQYLLKNTINFQIYYDQKSGQVVYANISIPTENDYIEVKPGLHEVNFYYTVTFYSIASDDFEVEIPKYH